MFNQWLSPSKVFSSHCTYFCTSPLIQTEMYRWCFIASYVSYKDIEKKLDKKTGAAETHSFLLAKLAENLDL
jgi:hypothetical protein